MAAADAVEPARADPVAFRRFYEANLARVYGYVLVRVAGSRTTAEDLTQEIFVAAVDEIRRGTEIGEPGRWIMGVARHKLVDHYRRRSREERLLLAVEPVVDDPGPDPTTERALEALAEVPSSQRVALVLRYLDGLSVPEVAAALRRSVHATESLLARGRARFRERYEEDVDERS